MHEDDQFEERKSKSQKKREFRELKSLGVQLASLTKVQLRNVPLSDDAREAILETHGMTRTALQRQLRRLQSFLANEDAAAIRAALTNELQPHAEAVAELHQAEQWRDRLLSADDSQIALFVERYPVSDRTHLRTLVRNAQKESERGRPPASARRLFKYVREVLDQGPPTDS